MRCPDKNKLSQYMRGALPTSELIATSEHVSSCDECKAQIAVLAAYRKAALLVGQNVLSINDCPEYEELSAYVDETLSHESYQHIDKHIVSCELCWRDVETLQAARSRSSLAPSITVHPGQFAGERKTIWLGWRRYATALAGAAIVLGVILSVPHQVNKPAGTVIAHNTVTQKPIIEEKPTPNAPSVNNTLNEKPSSVKLTDSNKTKPAGVVHHKTKIRVPKTEYIALNDGAVTVSETSGKLKANISDKTLASLVEKKLRDGKLPQSYQVAMNPDVFRGPSDEVKVTKVSPAPNALSDSKPEFRWNAVDGVSKYRVEVYEIDGTPVLATETDTTSFRPSTKLHGGYYKWVVRTRRAELAEWKWSKSEMFRVLTAKENNLIAEAKRDYPNSHLVAGSVYEHLGLHDKAINEFQSLVRENPTSAVAKKLLAGAESSNH